MDSQIREREDRLRKWFVQGRSRTYQVIDGLDIGWGGTARWVTAKMVKLIQKDSLFQILDVACGYGTFLAELGWRFPFARLFGLNLDFKGAHGIIFDLLEQANVKTRLVIADAIKLPFLPQNFDFVTCFLGLQDIEITRGQTGIIKAIKEMFRVVRSTGHVVLFDKYPTSTFQNWLISTSCSYEIILQDSVEVKCRWNREIGEAAVELYANGIMQQLMNQETPPENPEATLKEIRQTMQADLEQQLEKQGYYNPWGRMTVFLIKHRT